MGEFFQKMLTPQGEKEIYDGVSTCSRCGYCEQSCPTYVVTGKEGFNPRGRNQIFRMILEGKLKDPSKAEAALSSCLLCGACSSVCYAGVPTAEYVLEARRYIRKGKAPFAAALATWLLERPGLCAWVLRLANLAKRLGLARLASLLRLPTLAGLGGLEGAERRVHQAPLRFLGEKLESERKLSGSNWSYFAACGTNYLFPRVGAATLKCLAAVEGDGRFFGNMCCGLVAYNYGDVDDARRFARRVIARHESAPASPVVADCSSCAAHLKNYEQLFLGDELWQTRAKAFSAKVKDILEIAPKAAAKLKHDLPAGLRVTYHDSCRARNGEGLGAGPRELLKSLLGERFVELPEAEFCCGGAGSFAFAQPELSEAIVRRKVGAIASIQADLVLTSSTSCLLQLDDALRNYYPRAKVRHLAEFLAENLKP